MYSLITFLLDSFTVQYVFSQRHDFQASSNYLLTNVVICRDTSLETGDPARLLASLLGDSDKGIEIVYEEENIIFYWAD